jgi:hypothetical protein
MNYDPKYDPSSLSSRFSLLNSKHTELSRFEKACMEKKKGHDSIENKMLQIIPMIRLHVGFSESILSESLSIWK